MTHHEHKERLKIQLLEFYQHSFYASPSKIFIFSGKLPWIPILQIYTNVFQRPQFINNFFLHVEDLEGHILTFSKSIAAQLLKFKIGLPDV